MEVELERKNVLQQVTEVLLSSADRAAKARRIADAIRQSGNYRWVGIYEVDEQEIAAIAWSGIGTPAYPRFPVTQGLSGHAVATRSTVISNDVASDPRYLTAFGSTQSEIIVPIIAAL
jgi:GAF domain-containing protein